MDEILEQGRPSKIAVYRGFPQVRSCLLVAASIFAIADASLAQSSNTITLRHNNGDRIAGEFIETTQGAIRLQTLAGVVTVPLAELSCEGAACPSGETAQSALVLTALDGSFKVVGNLIEISDNQYVVATDLGEMRFDIDQALCSGIGCVTEVQQPTFGGAVALSDGNVVIEGQLVGLEESAYIVDVDNIGTLRIRSDLFQCVGIGCP